MPLNVHYLIALRSKTLQRINLLTLGSSSLRNLNGCSVCRSCQIAAGSACVAPRGVRVNDDRFVYWRACRTVFLSSEDWFLIHVIWSLGETWWWSVVKSGLRSRRTLLEHVLSLVVVDLDNVWEAASGVLHCSFRTVSRVGCLMALLSLCFDSNCTGFLEASD